MHVTTPPGFPGTDSPADPRGKHGDVDKNGDLVDELAAALRLAAAITAPTPDLARDQLQVVHRMLHRQVPA